MKVLEGLQRLGRALMLPIAVLPVAALLLRLGAPDVFDIPFIMQGGGAIFDNLPLLFGIGVAIGLARDNPGAAGLAGAVGYLVLTAALKTIDKSLNMGVLAGIVMGVVAGLVYNRFYAIKLPDWLGFFGGRRFVPIATGALAIVLAAVFSVIWPPIQLVIGQAGNWIIGAGAPGAFVYGVLNRLLIPTGLHHIINNLIWFEFGSFTTAAGQVVHGDLHRFFAGDKSAGVFMTGFFPVMMFGLPAACLAMYTAAKSQRRKLVAGVLLSVAVTAFVTGITEPVEYLFMFLAPALYGAHALLTGVSMAACDMLGIRMGFGFSAGAIDYVLNYGLGTRAWGILLLGPAYFVVYYLLFLAGIRIFDLKTPGRESEETPAGAGPDPGTAPGTDFDTLARAYILALGGRDNLDVIDACITRLRLTLREPSRADEARLRKLGAKGVVRVGDHGMQVVIGTQAENVAGSMRECIRQGTDSAPQMPPRPTSQTSGAALLPTWPKDSPSQGGTVVELVAPIDGEIMAIEDVPDPVFADKTVGDGVAILPAGNRIVAPADGVIGKIFDTNHAFSMLVADEIELFVHFGIDTVALKGQGFTRLVQSGAEVVKGEPIIELDLDWLKKNAKSVVTPVVIANMDAVLRMERSRGTVKAGKDVILRLTMNA